MSVGGIPGLESDESGRCVKLGADNKTCTIYATRPRICRVDEIKPPLLPRALWHKANLWACERLHHQVHGSPLEAEGLCKHVDKPAEE